MTCDSLTTCSIIPLQLHSCCQFHMPSQAGALVNYLFPSEKSPSRTLSGPRTCQSASPIFILPVTANFYERDHKGIFSTQCDFCILWRFVLVVLCVCVCVFFKKIDFYKSSRSENSTAGGKSLATQHKAALFRSDPICLAVFPSMTFSTREITIA